MDSTPTTLPAPEPSLTPALPPIPLVNPGFEEDANGWVTSGNAEAATIEADGQASELRLTHQFTEPYEVDTTQTVAGLADGWYTLRFWARSSGGQSEDYAALECGENSARVQIPSSLPGYRWISLAVAAEVTGGTCTIRLHSAGGPETWASFDNVALMPGRAALTVLGADLSSLLKSEDFGGIYRETDGTPGDALAILHAHGMNYARLRVWVDPADGYHNKERLLEMALRLQEQGLQLLVDFHYSDSWADPGKQNKPAAWADLDFAQLKQALYDHTFDVCSALVAQGTPPAMVQVGNEINAGMLWPDGRWDQLDNLAELLKAGYQAVKDCSPDTLVMLHIAEGGDNELARWWFDNMTNRDVPFDVIGISYYPFWHGSLAALQGNLADITVRYGREVIVAETAYAFTIADDDGFPNIFGADMEIAGYPITPAGQAAFLRDVMSIVRGVPGGRGLGVFYWDAVWTGVAGNGWDPADPSTGNAWENQALFDFDDVVLPALGEYLFP